MNMISEEVLALEPDIIAWRRHMHQNPELSFQEVHTTAYLTEELKKRGFFLAGDITTVEEARSAILKEFTGAQGGENAGTAGGRG